MTHNTLATLKTPCPGSLHIRCRFLPQEGTPYIPVKKRVEQYAPQYPVAHNPLRYKRQEDFATNISHAYKTQTSVAYTQSWDEYHKGLFSYYLYDHFGRPVETGQAKITHIRTGDQDKTRRMTDADIREHVHSLSNRINVMVAIYNDADPFMAYSIYPQDHQNDKITAIYYYPCIHASTPRGADGQYYPDGAWYAAAYHYNPNDSITTTSYQCTAGIEEPPIAENSTVKQKDNVTTTASLPAATRQQALIAATAPHNYNCPVKDLSVDALKQLCSQVFNTMYGHQPVPPGSFAADTLSSGKQTFCYQPYYSLHPFSHYAHQQSYNTQHYCSHHCRGATVSQNLPYYYCHSPPSLSQSGKATSSTRIAVVQKPPPHGSG